VDRAGPRWPAALLIGPAYLWLAVAVFLPLSAMAYFSVLTVAPFGPDPAVATLQHYRTIVERPFYLTLTRRSIILGLQVTALCALLGYPAAWVLARVIRGRWREAIFLLVVLPFWTNALVRTFAWTIVLRGDGLLDRAIHWAVPSAEPLDLLFSYPAIVIGLVHGYLPYMILTCYLSIQAIDGSLIEAAQSLGAGWVTVFRRVALPLSASGLAAGAVLTFVPVTGSFMEARILGGRQGITLGTVIEDQFTVVFNWPLGAALSFMLLAIVLALLALSLPLVRKVVA